MNGGTSLSEFGTLVVPEGVVSIGKSAFAGRHVKEIVLPSTLETIGDQAFENHQLTKLTLPANVKTIGKRAFRVLQEGLNHSLSSVNLNEGCLLYTSRIFWRKCRSDLRCGCQRCA